MNSSRVLRWMAVLAGATVMSCASSSATNTEPAAGTSNAETSQSEADTATATGSTPVEDEATATAEADTATTVEASAEEPATPTTEPASSETKKTETAATASEDSDHLSVVELKLAKEISDRNPVDPASTFSKGSKVFAWVKLNVKDSETQIKFQWLLDNAVMFTADPMTVKQSTGWRSWSYKTVDTTGTWKVAIIDVDDKVIHSQEFTVN